MLRSAEKCDRRSARIKRTEDEDKEGQTTPHSRKGDYINAIDEILIYKCCQVLNDCV